MCTEIFSKRRAINPANCFSRWLVPFNARTPALGQTNECGQDQSGPNDERR